MPVVVCRHCGGSGSCTCVTCGGMTITVAQQKEKLLCKGCRGTGKKRVPTDATTCPHCSGRGSCSCPSCGRMMTGVVGGQPEAGLCRACRGAGLV